MQSRTKYPYDDALPANTGITTVRCLFAPGGDRGEEYFYVDVNASDADTLKVWLVDEVWDEKTIMYPSLGLPHVEEGLRKLKRWAFQDKLELEFYWSPSAIRRYQGFALPSGV